MPFLKQTFMWIFFLVAMYLGGASTQSSSNMLQGMGFVSIVMALVCLYIIFKLMWRARGTITTIAVICGIVIYCAYTMGIFNGKTVGGIVTGKQAVVNEHIEDNTKMQALKDETDSLDAQLFGADIEEDTDNEVQKSGEDQKNNHSPEKQAENSQVQTADGGLVGKIKTFLFGQSEQAPTTIQKMDINPFEYPAVRGYARVVTGSTLYIGGLNVKMYGIDAPDISQTCADNHGRGYYCGRESRTWLQNWINNREVTCHILGKIENGWATGTCFVDNNKYDVAAVVVNAGWAVAFTKNTAVYVDYERQAKSNRRGLWAGTFYKPWDWRKIQNRKVEIKVKYNTPKPQKQKEKSGFDFWGLF